MATVFIANAQGTPPPPPDGGGGDGTVPDVLPINSLVYPFLIIGFYLGYFYLKKKSEIRFFFFNNNS